MYLNPFARKVLDKITLFTDIGPTLPPEYQGRDLRPIDIGYVPVKEKWGYGNDRVEGLVQLMFDILLKAVDAECGNGVCKTAAEVIEKRRKAKELQVRFKEYPRVARFMRKYCIDNEERTEEWCRAYCTFVIHKKKVVL